MAWVIARKVLGDRLTHPRAWLIPLRDVIFVVVWFASYAGHKIHWRGSDFLLRKGRLVRIAD
jgi:hypothetical protein